MKRNRYYDAIESDKFRESFIVVRFQPNSLMSQRLHPNRLSITIQSDKLFDIINENYVFERLQITNYTSSDLNRILKGSTLDKPQIKQKLLSVKNTVE